MRVSNRIVPPSDSPPAARDLAEDGVEGVRLRVQRLQRALRLGVGARFGGRIYE